MKKSIIQIFIAIPLFICIIFAFFQDTAKNDYVDIPSWILNDLCDNPRIIALSNRVVTFHNGSLPTLGIDLFMSLFSNFRYFREQPYLTIVDAKDNRIIFEQANTRINSFEFSKDGLWVIYNSANKIILQSLSTNMRKQVDESSAKFLDWSDDGKMVLFVEGGILLYSDISSCLANNRENCYIEKRIIPFYVNSLVDVQFAKIIQNKNILIKMRENNPEIISFSGEKLKEIQGKDYLAVDYLASKNVFSFIGPQDIDLFSTDFIKLQSVNLPIKVNYRSARWSPNADQLVFINNEASDLKYRFDNTSENSFQPSRLYLMEGFNPNSIHPIYKRTNEEIFRISWLYGKQKCKKP